MTTQWRWVSRRVKFFYLMPSGPDEPVDTVLWWSPDEPFTVRVKFRDCRRLVTWSFARELLEAGLAGPAGFGDIQFFPSLSHPASVEIVLDNPNGVAGLRCRRDTLRRFLDATYSVVPVSAETAPWWLDEVTS